MNEFLDLLAVPGLREMPSGRLDQRRAALIEFVETDLRLQAGRPGRLRVLRAWLMSLGVGLGLLAVVGSAFLAAHHGHGHRTRVSVETAVALGSGSVVASLAGLPRRSSVSAGDGRLAAGQWSRGGNTAVFVSFPGLAI